MRTTGKIITIMTILALTMLPVVGIGLSDGSDAQVSFDGNPCVTGYFSDMNDGTVTVKLMNDSDEEVKVVIKIVNYNNEDDVYSTKEVTIPAKEDEINGTVDCSLSWRLSNSGTEYVKVIVTTDGADPICNTLEISVSHSIWKDPITYVVIVVIIIVIIIAVWLRLRSKDSLKKSKDPNAKTFTQMHDEKNSSKAAKNDVSAEKKNYNATSERKAKRKQ